MKSEQDIEKAFREMVLKNLEDVAVYSYIGKREKSLMKYAFVRGYQQAKIETEE